MPQMFPSPLLFLVTLVSVLFLFSMARIFWHSISPNLSKLETGSQENFSIINSFTQTW